MTALVAVLLEALAPSYEGEFAVVVREKLRRATHGPGTDILVLGDSTIVSALRPSHLTSALPPGTTVYNFGIPATGPLGGEVVLRRYLRTHPAPKLVVLSYTPWAYEERITFFEEMVVAYVLDTADLLRTSASVARPDYLVAGLTTLLATSSRSTDLRNVVVSQLIDSFPVWREPARDALGYGDDPLSRFKFLWYHTSRSARNSQLTRALDRDNGWHYWKSAAMPGEQLPRVASFQYPKIVISPREGTALDRLLRLCGQAGVSVLALPPPQPAGRVAELKRRGALDPIREFLTVMAVRHPHFQLTEQVTLPTPHRFFSDNTHLNPAGAHRYTETVAPMIMRVYGEAEH